MIAFDVKFNEGWPDLKDKPHIHVGNTIGINVLDLGTKSGRPSVALRIDLPDGQVVIAETTARLFCTAGRMVQARYPDLFADP